MLSHRKFSPSMTDKTTNNGNNNVSAALRDVQDIAESVRDEAVEIGGTVRDQVEKLVERGNRRAFVIQDRDENRIAEVPAAFGVAGAAFLVAFAPPRLLVTIAIGLLFARLHIVVEDADIVPDARVRVNAQPVINSAKRTARKAVRAIDDKIDENNS